DRATARSARRGEGDRGQPLDGSAAEVLVQGVTRPYRARGSRGCAPVPCHRAWGSFPSRMLEKKPLRTAVYADRATHQGHWRRFLSGCKPQATRGTQGYQGRCADCVTTRPEGRMAMQVKTRVKAGGFQLGNHNETLVRTPGQPKGLQVK